MIQRAVGRLPAEFFSGGSTWGVLPILVFCITSNLASAETPTASPMDQPLQLAAKAIQVYNGMRDYSCTFVKRELVGGKLQPNHIIQMNARTAPYAVSFKWQEPSSLRGQEAYYVTGRNSGKMRVKGSGGLGVFGYVTLDPRDPRAMKTSRHPITESGLGNLLDRLAKGWAQQKQLGVTKVNIGTYEYARRRCTRVEAIHTANPGQQLIYSRTIVYFDNESHLPIRIENYDWPRYQGDTGQLVEMYSYVNLRSNIGIPASAFAK